MGREAGGGEEGVRASGEAGEGVSGEHEQVCHGKDTRGRTMRETGGV